MSRLLSRSGHRVVVGSRDPARARALGGPFGRAVEVASLADAAAGAEVMVLATLWADTEEVLAECGPLDGRVLVDCTNPEATSGRALVVGHTTSGAEMIATWAPGARVVKAFNHVYAEILDEGPRFGAATAAVFVCGDDPDARRVVAELAASCGFQTVDAGALATARSLEPLAMLMVELVRGQGRAPGGAAIGLLERS